MSEDLIATSRAMAEWMLSPRRHAYDDSMPPAQATAMITPAEMQGEDGLIRYVGRLMKELIAAADPTATPTLQVRYDVLFQENARLQASEEAARKELAALRQAPDPRPRTFSADEVQDEINRRGTAELNRQALLDAQAEIRDLKEWVVAFGMPWAAKWARDYGLPENHMHATHYDILAQCGARMTDFTRVVVKGDEPA